MKRLMQNHLEEIIRSDDQRVILLEGARQVGKSYLVGQALKAVGLPSYSFDLEKDLVFRRQLDETVEFPDFRALLENRYGVADGGVLFIDEAQESRKLAHYVKSFKEDWPELKVVLTGSSMNRLFGSDIRIPVGRTHSLCLYGFSFSEFVQYVHGEDLADYIRSAPQEVEPSLHELLLELYDRYLKVGGYPEAVIAFQRGEDALGIVDEIISTQEEDFARKEAYDPELFRSALRATANHIGSPSKYTHLDTTKYKAKQITAALKAWHLLLEVEVQSLNPERDGFLPKRYLHDLAAVNWFRTLAAPSISILDTIDPMLRTPLGGVFENAVLINLLNGLSAYAEVGTWKKGSNTAIEVDFVLSLDGGAQKIPIECKAALQLKKSHYKNVLTYLKITRQHIGMVVSAAPLERRDADGHAILNVPVYLAERSNLKTFASGIS